MVIINKTQLWWAGGWFDDEDVDDVVDVEDVDVDDFVDVNDVDVDDDVDIDDVVDVDENHQAGTLLRRWHGGELTHYLTPLLTGCLIQKIFFWGRPNKHKIITLIFKLFWPVNYTTI